jgi:hypothetical protein
LSPDSLLHRLIVLELKAAALEHRIRSLEASTEAGPAPARLAPASAKWRVRANWRALRQGMTMTQVRALLGEPDRVNAPAMILWSWGQPPNDAGVYFVDEKLAGWSEPEW